MEYELAENHWKIPFSPPPWIMNSQTGKDWKIPASHVHWMLFKRVEKKWLLTGRTSPNYFFFLRHLKSMSVTWLLAGWNRPNHSVRRMDDTYYIHWSAKYPIKIYTDRHLPCLFPFFLFSFGLFSFSFLFWCYNIQTKLNLSNSEVQEIEQIKYIWIFFIFVDANICS